QSSTKRCSIPQVSGDAFGFPSIEGSQITRRTHQDAHLFATRRKLPRYMASKKACRPGDQCLHSTRSLPSEETRSVFGGGGINVVVVVPPPVWPLVGPPLPAP